jgi:protein-S-isoprenylcysteine O-methyltransferase Ste14
MITNYFRLKNLIVMNEFNLSHILSSVLGCTFILVRVFFSLRFRKNESSNQKDNSLTLKERNLNFVVRRFLLLPLLIVSIWIYYFSYPFWMNIFQLFVPETILWIVFFFGIAGTTFLIWVHLSLGKEWSANLMIKNEHTLIKSGPYSKIRHPMYTSLFIIYLSFALLTCNYIIIILTLLAIISLIMRIPKEEEMLISEFGEDYKNYMLSTGRFFPKL